MYPTEKDIHEILIRASTILVGESFTHRGFRWEMTGTYPDLKLVSKEINTRISLNLEENVYGTA